MPNLAAAVASSLARRARQRGLLPLFEADARRKVSTPTIAPKASRILTACSMPFGRVHELVGSCRATRRDRAHAESTTVARW